MFENVVGGKRLRQSFFLLTPLSSFHFLERFIPFGVTGRVLEPSQLHVGEGRYTPVGDWPILADTPIQEMEGASSAGVNLRFNKANAVPLISL